MLILRLLLTSLFVFTTSFQAGPFQNQNQSRGKNGNPSSSNPQPTLNPHPLPTPVSTTERAPITINDGPINLGVDLVVLDALVLHQKTGRIEGALKATDFVLQEDGVQQQITHFSQDTLPLSVIFLVDRGGCLDPFSEKVRQATQEALIRLKPKDEAALMAFADDTALVTDFTTRRERIAQGLDRLPPHNESAAHCFSEALYRAADYMRQAGNPDGRRVIIVLTAITTHWDCGGHSGEQARQALLESGAVVCAVIPKTPGQRLESGIMRAAAGLGGFGGARVFSLNKIVEETGGEMMTDKPAVLDQTFHDLIDHLRTRYSLGFVSSNTKRDGTFRKLKLDLAQGAQSAADKLVVKTKKGYYSGRK